MGLKLKELQKIVKSVIREEKNFKSLSEEMTKVLGPTVLTSHGLENMSRSANERLDVLEALDRPVEKARTSILTKFIDSESVETRKLVARLIPENFLKVFVKDSSPSVRAAAAARMPLFLVEEMCRRFPNDDTLYSIAKIKRLNESGVPTPKVEDEEFDMYGEESMRDMVRSFDEPELSEQWYDSTARNIVKQYGENIEGQWEEIAVKNYCDSMESMGVEVEYEKLLDAVYDLLSEREDAVLEESLNESTYSRFREIEVMPTISESMDPVTELLTEGLTGSGYLERFNEVFSVTHSRSENPSYIFGINEGAETVVHPCSATSPGRCVSSSDERAIDSYVKAWNSREHLSGNKSYRLSWSHDPEVINMVNFHLELK